jgi:hypothetical protein
MTFKILTAASALVLATAAPALAQPPAAAQKEREAAVAHLEATRAKFLKSIDGLTEAQWRFKPAPDRWSIAEVAEHIAISEGTILGLVQTQILKGPAPKAEERSDDQKVLDGLVDRTAKFQAPEILKPVNKWPTREALTKDFNTARAATITFVRTTVEDLRAHGGPHPVFKMLDAHQWILLISGHSERHTLQIEEVKTAPGYPK